MSPLWIVPVYAALLAGRASHAWDVSNPGKNFRFRAAGMVATLIVLARAVVLGAVVLILLT